MAALFQRRRGSAGSPGSKPGPPAFLGAENGPDGLEDGKNPGLNPRQSLPRGPDTGEVAHQEGEVSLDIDTPGAMVLRSELGDLRRFGSPRQLMAWDCAPRFDPGKGSVNATLAGVEALRFEISERGLVAYA